jgi:hypothetical protein
VPPPAIFSRGDHHTTRLLSDATGLSGATEALRLEWERTTAIQVALASRAGSGKGPSPRSPFSPDATATPRAGLNLFSWHPSSLQRQCLQNLGTTASRAGNLIRHFLCSHIGSQRAVNSGKVEPHRPVCDMAQCHPVLVMTNYPPIDVVEPRAKDGRVARAFLVSSPVWLCQELD